MKIAFIHPDLGIGGAERLVIDAATGLQSLGHEVTIYTSHHDPKRSFPETNDGTLKVHAIRPPFPRSIGGKFHIILAHLRQLHLILTLLFSTDRREASSSSAKEYDIFFIDQLSTSIPLIRYITLKRVIFYLHFPDKLLSDGAYVDSPSPSRSSRGWFRGGIRGVVKRVYRLPMDWFEEVTTRNADIIIANSHFTSRVASRHLPSLAGRLSVVYPGINFDQYTSPSTKFSSVEKGPYSGGRERPTFVSLNRFERKKDLGLAIRAFALFKSQLPPNSNSSPQTLSGYDDRLKDNTETLSSLLALAHSLDLTTYIRPLPSPTSSPTSLSSKIVETMKENPDVTMENCDILFLPNFTLAERSALLSPPPPSTITSSISSPYRSTLALLYTPQNEHFGIGPVESMACGIGVLACDSGGPRESLVDIPDSYMRTGWLRPPEPEAWAKVLTQIYTLHTLSLSPSSTSTSPTPSSQAQTLFSMQSMSSSLQSHLEEAINMGPVDPSRNDELGALSTLLGWGLVGLVMLLGIAVGRLI
ncbi:UDP-Glycosyltransferase/glycogen phosphorylase [Sistotremastrum niveocremeum HHB9708]|uniref:Alpha-1,3/1,6-mannosyltransferase ALG2 n=1 Tax=Sistotremastrum niveocremeum HHB9708 TaxID=1314777 RepID=A0A165AAW4_9AGAM|nr:UDP-Glycosyltransferase/glycogen phosphorylase [Sistotremastrum niveocremeum HHB9708]